MKKIILFACVFYLGVATNVFSQPNETTQQHYWQTLRAARDRALAIPSCSVARVKYFDKGKLQSTEEIISELLSPNKTRYLTAEKIRGRVTSEEIIGIDGTYYCRKNNGSWIQSKDWCGRRTLSAMPNAVSSAFTVEEIKIDGRIESLFRQYLTYGGTQPINGKGEYYYESKYWLNSEGLITREESKTGIVASNIISEESETTYEHNPKDLKIEAPIIKRK